METIGTILSGIGGLLLGGLALSMWYGGDKTLAIWAGFAGCVCFLLAGAIQMQDYVWRTEAKSDLTEADFVRDRAYISVVWERLLDYRPDSQIGAEIVIENVGNTPAFKFKTKTTIGIRSYPLPVGADFIQVDVPLTETTLYKGQKVRSATKLREPLPTAIFNQIADGEKWRLFVWGISTYETLGRERYKRFCFVIHGPRANPMHPEICDQHNDGN